MASAADEFLKTVLRSGLLTKADLQTALANVPVAGLQDAQAIADQLVHLGLLTQFQVGKLLQGASFGLQLGPYRILTPIGKGGMGMVYLGLDMRSKQHVAVKVLSPIKKREGDRHVQRFRRELEIAKDLLHPHLVIAHDTGEEKDRDLHYLVMEYVPGQTLYRLVTTQGVLPVARTAHLFAEVASALEYAHSQGLIHRDLKPANVMVTPNDHAKVLDLGLAIVEGEAVESAEVIGGKGHVVGTFDYIAPEQTRDAAKVDARADIYSLGCTLYFALTGRPPFPAGTPLEKIQAHRRLEPEPIQKLNPTVPEGFAFLVRQFMAKQPEQRPPSMASVRALLLPWAASEADKPLDQAGDTAFQAAVAALETAPLPAGPVAESLDFGREFTLERDTRFAGDARYRLLLAGVAGIWLLVALLVILIFVLR
ncbi:MAG: serine/threonine protein kinase [Gemmataceae bacterium]|nr:serine/threonine protein kinase [Gemmataceae bacterium]